MPSPTPEVRPAVIDLIDGRLARLLPGGLLRLHQVTRRVRELAASESVRSLGGRAHPLDHPDPLVNRFHNRYFGARGLIWNPNAALLNDSSEASNSATCSTETGREQLLNDGLRTLISGGNHVAEIGRSFPHLLGVAS